jgi:hypothetical protein
MGRSHPVELRSRVIAFVEQGHGHDLAARHFRVLPRFVKDTEIVKRETGGPAPMKAHRRNSGEVDYTHA